MYERLTRFGGGATGGSSFALAPIAADVVVCTEAKKVVRSEVQDVRQRFEFQRRDRPGARGGYGIGRPGHDEGAICEGMRYIWMKNGKQYIRYP